MPERIQLRLVSSNMFEIGDRMRVCLKALPLPLIAHGLKTRRNRPRGREVYEGRTIQTLWLMARTEYCDHNSDNRCLKDYTQYPTRKVRL